MQSRVNDTDRTRDQSTLRPGNTGSSSATPTTPEISITHSDTGPVSPTTIGSTPSDVTISIGINCTTLLVGSHIIVRTMITFCSR